MVAEGTVSILGVNGLTLFGTATIRVNTSGAEVHESLEIPNSSSAPIVLEFATTADVEIIHGDQCPTLHTRPDFDR